MIGIDNFGLPDTNVQQFLDYGVGSLSATRMMGIFQVRLRGSILLVAWRGAWLSPQLCWFAQWCVGCMAGPVACCLPPCTNLLSFIYKFFQVRLRGSAGGSCPAS
jgi:hypothetical protein